MENLASDSIANDHPAGETSISRNSANLLEHASPEKALSDDKPQSLSGQMDQEHGHLTPTRTTASNLPSTAFVQETPLEDPPSLEQVITPKLTNMESGEPASKDIGNTQIRNSALTNNNIEGGKESESVKGDESIRGEKEANDRFGEYVNRMEERLSILEEDRAKSRRSSIDWGNRDDSGDESPPSSIPKLHRVKWFEFKNIFVGDKRTYAIEVLEGPAKYWYQFGEQTRDINDSSAADDGDQNFSSTYDSGTQTRTPDRIRINSKPLRLILAHLSDSPFSPRSVVMLRPFKLLVYYENSIRETLTKLEHKWGDVDRRESSEQAPLSYQNQGNEDGLLGGSKPKPRIEEVMDSVEALRDLRCLVEFIDHDLRPTMDSLKDDSCQKVRFEDLWHIFQPGVEVYSPRGTCMKDEKMQPVYNQMYQEYGRVIVVGDGRPRLKDNHDRSPHAFPVPKIDAFKMRCYYIDYNGTTFGPMFYTFSIYPFEGEREIRSLGIYPLRFAAGASGIRDRLRKRGEKFLDFTTSQLRFCHGKTLTCQPDGSSLERGSGAQLKCELTSPSRLVDSEVIIDFKEVIRIFPNYAPQIFCDLPLLFFNELDDSYPVKYWKDEERQERDHISFDRIHYDLRIDAMLTQDYRNNDSTLRDCFELRPIQSADLHTKDLILLPERVFGCILQDDSYVLLNINDLHPVKPRESIHNLKLPHGHKKIVQALVQSHFDRAGSKWRANSGDDEPDLIHGKGKSLVILLHGISGVGKTATAEWVAQANGKPLYPLTFSSLGLDPIDVEYELRARFRLAELWGCILLLDEADVYLAPRSTSNLRRNSLVAVFFRALECFSGVIFLTTNRIKELDYALNSRIDVKLYYPPLTEKQTRNIWKSSLHTLLSSRPSLSCDERGILEFAASRYTPGSNKTPWDGRQIRNAIKTATLLAESDARDTRARHDPSSPPPPVHPRLEKKHFELVAGDVYTPPPVTLPRRRVESDDDDEELAPWPRRPETTTTANERAHAEIEARGRAEAEAGTVPANWIDLMDGDSDSD